MSPSNCLACWSFDQSFLDELALSGLAALCLNLEEVLLNKSVAPVSFLHTVERVARFRELIKRCLILLFFIFHLRFGRRSTIKNLLPSLTSNSLTLPLPSISWSYHFEALSSPILLGKFSFFQFTNGHPLPPLKQQDRLNLQSLLHQKKRQKSKTLNC